MSKLTTEQLDEFYTWAPQVMNMAGRLFEHLRICPVCSPQSACERAQDIYGLYVQIQQNLLECNINYIVENFPSGLFPALLEGRHDFRVLKDSVVTIKEHIMDTVK